MKNKSLAKDYVVRSEKRILAIETLFKNESWADVVRQSQEVVELSLKALLRHCNIEIPRLHDVSGVLTEEKKILPSLIQKNLDQIVEISRELRRDRELAFYGSEDLTPSEFYKKKDAARAMKQAQSVLNWVSQVIL